METPAKHEDVVFENAPQLHVPPVASEGGLSKFRAFNLCGDLVGRRSCAFGFCQSLLSTGTARPHFTHAGLERVDVIAGSAMLCRRYVDAVSRPWLPVVLEAAI